MSISAPRLRPCSRQRWCHGQLDHQHQGGCVPLPARLRNWGRRCWVCCSRESAAEWMSGSAAALALTRPSRARAHHQRQRTPQRGIPRQGPLLAPIKTRSKSHTMPEAASTPGLRQLTSGLGSRGAACNQNPIKTFALMPGTARNLHGDGRGLPGESALLPVSSE